MLQLACAGQVLCQNCFNFRFKTWENENRNFLFGKFRDVADIHYLIMTTILKIKLLDRDLFHAYSLAIIPVDANQWGLKIMIDLVQKRSKLIAAPSRLQSHKRKFRLYFWNDWKFFFLFFKSFKYNALYKKVKKANLFSTGSSHERVKR